MERKYTIHEWYDFGGGGPLSKERLSYSEAKRQIKKLYSTGSIFVSYGIYDEEEGRYVP